MKIGEAEKGEGGDAERERECGKVCGMENERDELLLAMENVRLRRENAVLAAQVERQRAIIDPPRKTGEVIQGSGAYGVDLDIPPHPMGIKPQTTVASFATPIASPKKGACVGCKFLSKGKGKPEHGPRGPAAPDFRCGATSQYPPKATTETFNWVLGRTEIDTTGGVPEDHDEKHSVGLVRAALSAVNAKCPVWEASQ